MKNELLEDVLLKIHVFLNEYAQHTHGCNARWHGEYPPTGSCGCGFEADLSLIKIAIRKLKNEQET